MLEVFVCVSWGMRTIRWEPEKNEDETNFTDMEINNMFVDLLGPDIPYEN